LFFRGTHGSLDPSRRDTPRLQQFFRKELFFRFFEQGFFQEGLVRREGPIGCKKSGEAFSRKLKIKSEKLKAQRPIFLNF
jgi:hypothetical protein